VVAEEQGHLLVHVGDRLLALAVHVEDLQEGLVDALVRGEASLGKKRGLKERVCV